MGNYICRDVLTVVDGLTISTLWQFICPVVDQIHVIGLDKNEMAPLLSRQSVGISNPMTGVQLPTVPI